MTVTLPQLAGSTIVTHSRAGCFKACPHKHWMRYVLGVRPASSSVAQGIGSAVHDAIDARFKGADIDAVRDIAGKVQHNGDDVAYDRVTAQVLATGYMWRWGHTRPENPTDMMFDRCLASEIPFELVIPGVRGLRVAGKIDRIVGLQDGRIVIGETKTTSEDIEPGSLYWQVAEIDTQETLYVWAARKMGYAVHSVVRDVIRKPTIRPKQIHTLDADGLKIVLDANNNRVYLKSGKPRQSPEDDTQRLVSRTETPAEFGERLTADIFARPDFYYQRKELPRMDREIEELEHDLRGVANAMRDSIKHDRHYRNTASCRSYGGCEYLSVCKSFDPAVLPNGFIRVDDIHPELTTKE